MVVDDPEVRAEQRLARGAPAARCVLRVQRRDHALGQAVQFDHAAIEALEKSAAQVRMQRGSATHHRLQRGHVARARELRVEHALVLHRDHRGVSDALARNGVQERVRVEARLHVERPPREQRAEHADPGDVRVQADRDERSRTAVVAQRDREVVRPVAASGVRVHDALGHARGAGAVDDVQELVAGDGRERTVRPRERQEPVPVEPARVCFAGLHEQAKRVAAAIAQGVDPAALVASRDDCPSAAVAQHAEHGLVRDRQVDRHGDGARAHDAEQRVYGRGFARHQHRHALAGADAACGKRGGHCRDAAMELAPGLRDPVDDERRLVAAPLAVKTEDLGQQRRASVEPVHALGSDGTPRPGDPHDGGRPARATQKRYSTVPAKVRGGP